MCLLGKVGQSIVVAMRFQKIFDLLDWFWAGSVGLWVMGKWAVGQRIVGVMSFQKRYVHMICIVYSGDIVDMSLMRDEQQQQQGKIMLLSF